MPERMWKPEFHKSKWFKRGWTLQELIAPKSVEFFSQEGDWLGNKETLEQHIHEITTIPVSALRGEPLSAYTEKERLRWAEGRETKYQEDQAYCLPGIFGNSMKLNYGEGDLALTRLITKLRKPFKGKLSTTLASAVHNTSILPSIQFHAVN